MQWSTERSDRWDSGEFPPRRPLPLCSSAHVSCRPEFEPEVERNSEALQLDGASEGVATEDPPPNGQTHPNAKAVEAASASGLGVRHSASLRTRSEPSEESFRSAEVANGVTGDVGMVDGEALRFDSGDGR